MGIPLFELRAKHRALRYRSFSYEQLPDHSLACSFDIVLEPGIQFRPTVVIDAPHPLTVDLDIFVFHVGLVELISYWKCACPQKVIVECGALSPEQILWWRDLFTHGLGEFFFLNDIDFSSADFLSLESSSKRTYSVQEISTTGDLIFAGGGKDSALSLELLPPAPDRGVFILGPSAPARASAQAVGHKKIISASRTIDPTLLALNKAGYLNGHTPFSAYLAFLGTLVGAAHGSKHLIVSNERSADEGNSTLHGIEINHQYSKSFRFESAFRTYAQKFLTPSVSYFSLLRPLHDLQVTALFSRYPRQHSLFRSCNVNQRQGTWCCACPKCAFVFLSLSPFLSLSNLVLIFGEDLFENSNIHPYLLELLGEEGIKPFECVGTIRESQAALAASLRRRAEEGASLPEPLRNAIRGRESDLECDFAELLREFSPSHALPPGYLECVEELMGHFSEHPILL